MSKAADRLGDALLSVVDTAEANGATYDEVIETLESATEGIRTEKLVEYGMAFWQSAENPTANDMDILFTAIASRNYSQLEELLTRFHVQL